jgi:large repetitive protein
VTIPFTVTDNNGAVSTAASAVITVVAVNDAPVDGDETNNVTEDITLTVLNGAAGDLLNNATDADGDPMTITGFTYSGIVGTPVIGIAFTIPSKGDITINADGSYIFVPTLNFNGTLPVITYTVSDGQGGMDSSTLSLEVLAVNDAPAVATPIPNQTGIDNQSGISIDTSTAFTDPDTADTLTYSATGLPLGLAINTTNGEIAGTIDNSASQNGNTGTPTDGVYTIMVTAVDGNGGTVTDTFTYTVTNPAPIAQDDVLTIGEDAVLTGLNIMGSNGNGIDSDPDGDTPLTVTQVNGLLANVGQPTDGSDGGSFTIFSTGVVSFDPQQDFQYLDDGETVSTTVTYQLSDGEGGFDTATVEVTVTGTNDTPVIVLPSGPGPFDPNDFIPDQSGTDGDPLTDYDVSMFFGDPDTSDTLSFSSPDLPIWMSMSPEGLITGIPPLNASTGGPNNDGVYLITIEVTDGDETITTTLEYTIGNLPPEAVSDGYTAEEDLVLTVPIATGLTTANDTDGDGDPLTVTQLNGVTLVTGVPVTLPSGAILTLNDDGSFDYNPNGAFEDLELGEDGTDTFTYQIGDGDGLFATATVMITINGANDLPVAQDDVFGITENGTPVNGNVLLDNDYGIDSDVDASDILTVTQVGGNAAGVNTPVAGSMGGLFTVDAQGNLTFVDNGEFEDLGTGQTRDTTVTYQISDGNGGFDDATVTVTVTGVNDAPVLFDPANPTMPLSDPDNVIPDVSTTDGATPLDPNVGDYFVDPEGDPLTFTAAGLPSGLAMNPDGSIVGTVDPDASQGGPNNDGIYDVVITADDGNGGVTTTTLTYTIMNQTPVSHNDTASVGEDIASVVGNVITPLGVGDVADVDGALDSDVLSVVSAVQGTTPITIGTPFTTAGGGILTLLADGGYTFVPSTAYNGLDDGETALETITYTVSDGNGGTDTATLTLTVLGSNDAPVIVDPLNLSADPTNPTSADPDTIVPVQSVTDGQVFGPTTPLVNLAPYAVDPDSDLLTFTTTSPLPTGLTLNSDGTITGTVDPSASQGGDPLNQGLYTITVLVSDGTTTTPLTLVIDVSNVPPINILPIPQVNTYPTIPFTLDTTPFFTVPDGAVLEYSAAGMPSGFTIDPVTGVITGSPALDANAGGPNGDGIYQITITVDDKQGGTATYTFVLAVKTEDFVAPPTAPNDPVLPKDRVPVTPDKVNLHSVLTRAMNGIVPLNADYDAGGRIYITALIDYIRALDAPDRHENFFGQDDYFYMGGSDAVLSSVGNAALKLEMAFWQDVVYINIRDLAPTTGSSSISQAYLIFDNSMRGITRQMAPDLYAIDSRSLLKRVEIVLEYRLGNGAITRVPFSLDAHTGSLKKIGEQQEIQASVTPVNDFIHQHANLHSNQSKLLVAALGG